MVLEEQQQQKYSNSNCAAEGGHPSKKLKQKKIPQRGLGVAQLEKIRLEEQQQKNIAATGFSPHSFVLPLPPYHRQQLSSSSFPASPTDLSSASSLFGTPPSTLNLPTSPLPPPQHPKPPFQMIEILNSSHQGGSTGGSSSSSTSPGQGHNSRIWNNGLNYNGDVEITRLDHRLPCQTQLQKEASYPIRHSPSPVVIDSLQPRSSTMVYFPPLTSGLDLPLELPSNQSIGNNKNNGQPSRPPPWPEEEKMVGRKRPWAFSLDNLQPPPSLSKIPSTIKPIYGPEESSFYSNGNGRTFKFEPANSIIKQSTSTATVLPIDCKGTTEVNHKNGVRKENRILEGDFLTLGPPAVGSSSMGSKSNKQQHITSLEFDSPPSSLGSIEEPPIYSFFPPEGQISRVATTNNNHQRVDDSGTVDLNLKL